MRALTIFAQTPLPETKSGMARAMNAAIDEVARHLGNTRSVCRKCYIHPEVIVAWAEGRLARELEAVKKARRKPLEGLDDEEMLVLNWLTAAGK